MPLQENRIFVIGRDGKNMYLIARADLERRQLPGYFLFVVGSRQVEGQHGACFSCASTRCTSTWRSAAVGQNPARQFEHIGHGALVQHLVNRRPPHHPLHRHLRPHRGNHDGVAIFQTLQVGTNAVQQ